MINITKKEGIIKKQQLVDQYKIMAKDEDYLSESVEMAEMGMEYYLTDIERTV